MPGLPLRDVVIAGELRDGALRVDRIEATGVHGGRASAGLDLRSSGGGYRVGTRGRLEGVRLVASSRVGRRKRVRPSTWSLGWRVRADPSTRSPANLDGAVLVVVGEGQISNSHDFIASGVLVGLLDALNPFRESSDHTDFECGVALATLTNGKMGVAPIAARTDRLTVVGHGIIDFDTEGVELEWTLKPRRGIGLSPGSIANPYVKLGGTLSSPRLEMKPLEAAASTGAAVATRGSRSWRRGSTTGSPRRRTSASVHSRRPRTPSRNDADTGEGMAVPAGGGQEDPFLLVVASGSSRALAVGPDPRVAMAAPSRQPRPRSPSGGRHTRRSGS